MLKILEHSSSSYGPRTYANAKEADVTIALAVDYTTAGEKLTHKAAGDKYLALKINTSMDIVLARILFLHMRKYNCKSINVAGNGIFTLTKHGINQEYINRTLYNIISLVSTHLPINHIYCGGQTGVDLAGAIAGYKLGIDTTVLLPKGFKQRHEDGIDVNHTYEEILAQITGENK